MQPKPHFFPDLTIGGIDNATRAVFAEAAFVTFMCVTRTRNAPPLEVLPDLLADLLHLLDAAGYEDSEASMRDALETAVRHWRHERDPKNHEGSLKPVRSDKPHKIG